jgi:ribonuclease E
MKSEKSIDTTAIKTNLEAATEIARQIQLRDIAGLIVIDFIDMMDPSYSSKVEKKFKENMSNDYSNVQIGKISQFGLLEVSRQRLRQSLSDRNFVTCRHCNGTGRILSNETVGMSIIRQIEGFLVDANAKSIVVEVANGIDLYILNSKRDIIVALEKQHEVFIEVIRNPSLSPSDCKIIIKEFKQTIEEEPTRQEYVKKENYKSSRKAVPLNEKVKQVNKSKETTRKHPMKKTGHAKNHKTEPLKSVGRKNGWIKKIFG